MNERDPNFASSGQSDFDREIERVLPSVLGAIVVALIVFLFFPAMIFSVVITVLVLLLHKKKHLKYAGIFGVLALAASFCFLDFRPLFQFPIFFQSKIPLYWYSNLVNAGEPLIVSPLSYVQAFLLALPLSWVWSLIARKFFENRLTVEKERKKKKLIANSKMVNNIKARQKRLKTVQSAFRKNKKNTDILMGINISGKPVFMPYDAIFKHCLIQGTTGSGKTYAMYNILETALRDSIASIFIDGKGDPKTQSQIEMLANLYGKNVTVFSDRTQTRSNP